MINLRSLKYVDKKPQFSFSSQPINATSRKLEATFSLEAMEDIRAMYSIDLKQEIINGLVDEL